MVFQEQHFHLGKQSVDELGITLGDNSMSFSSARLTVMFLIDPVAHNACSIVATLNLLRDGSNVGEMIQNLGGVLMWSP